MREKKERYRSVCLRLLLFGMVWIFLSIGMQPVYAQETDSGRKTVKVGFFALDGYHEMDVEGIRSGYGYDFLKMTENYNNWKFDYIGYDQGWDDMLNMLDTGEIDMVTFAQKTAEREEKYDFSDSPIGTGSLILSVKSGDTRYQAGNKESYDGMRIGLIKGSTHEEMLRQYALENGFSYETVYFDDLEEMKENLLSGDKIDAMVSSSLRMLEDETVLEEMDPIDFYVIVKKGNTELLSEINHAIAQLDMEVPGWRLTLKNQYYTTNEEADVVLSQEELQYLEELELEQKVFTVVTNPDLAPYSYFEDGEAKGIAPDIFRKIAEKIGIQYEFKEFDTYQEYNEFVRTGMADIDLTCFSNYGLAEEHQILLSNSYMSTSLAMLSKDTFDGTVNTVAELEAAQYNTTYSEELFGTTESKTYDTHEQCIQAVLSGEADVTYMYTYAAQKAVEEDEKNRLMYTIMPEYTIELAMGVNEKEDYRLLNMIDEGIASVKGSYAQHVIQNELANIKEKDTVISIIYDYPEVALFLSVGLLVFVFMMIIMGVKMVGNGKEQQQAKELSRFMGYVCEANEVVMEINLDHHSCSIHNMENGKLVSMEMPYHKERQGNYKDMIHPDDLKKISDEQEAGSFWEIFKEDGQGEYFEARAKKRDGTYNWYSYTIRKIPKDKKHPNNFILFKKDIDKAKKLEEAQITALKDALENARNASSAKGQFLSKMSHEIRTPLNAVIGYMSIAKDSRENLDKLTHCIENSEMAAKHLLSIINDVLDISSIESGKMKIAHEEFDLKSQITNLSTLFYNQAKEKNVRFEVQLKDIQDEWVIGDSLRVNQILMNLLSNAVKFTPEEGLITLGMTQMRTDEAKIYMKFEVSDTGIGMSEEYQKKLFQPFEQESAITAQKYGGTGLGLSITLNLVNMMGGSIDVKSRMGEGTQFTVSLHFDKSAKAHEMAQKQHDYSHVRALIVDDDDGSCEYTKKLLKRCQVKCDVVRDGASAIKQIRRRMDTEYQYDLCIMDWNMPSMDGIEAAKRIKTECEVKIPIVIATAYDVTAIEDQAREAGITRVIAKPLFQSTMFDLLVSTFGKYEPVEQEEHPIINLQGLHVLLAEDNPMNLEIATDILKKAGIEVWSVTDGEQAVQQFTTSEAKTYDVILMDIQMPVMDGYQATREIRKSGHSEAKTIPIIAMTANAFAEDVAAALTSGMNGHIAKPIDYDKLFDVLSRFYNKKEEDERNE